MTTIRKWEVVEDWEYQLPGGPKVVIPKTFVFDGASVPRPLWGILSPTGLLLIPGLIHDFAYRYDYLWAMDDKGSPYKFKENAGRKYWDKIFREVGIHINGMRLLDTIAWLALATMGCLAWKANRERSEPELTPQKSLQPIQSAAKAM